MKMMKKFIFKENFTKRMTKSIILPHLNTEFKFMIIDEYLVNNLNHRKANIFIFP